MDISVVTDNIPLYLTGLWTTIRLVAGALVCGLILAIPIALLMISKNPLIWGLPWLFTYFFRGTPLLVQLYMIYHGLSQFDFIRESFLWPVFKEAYWCALIAFSLNTAAYTAEVLRGSIVQTPHGEIEAAKACGMSRGLMLRRVILPGAFRRALPAYGNEVIFMLHGSAVAGVVTIVDLFGAARIVNSRTFAPFESYIAAGLLYLCVTFIIVWAFKQWEKRWHAHLRPRETTGEADALAKPA